MAQAGSIDSHQAHAQPLELDKSTAAKPPESDEPISDNTRSNIREEVSAKIQELTNHALHFLSNATNETLGACLVGLGAITYLVLGRIGLVLIGVVGGVVLHATWEENNQNQTDDTVRALEVAKKRERGFDIIERILGWRGRSNEGVSEDDHLHIQDSTHTVSNEEDFSNFQPAARAALTNLTDAVIRNYVNWWYSPLLPLDISFPSSCRQTFARFLLTISSHLSRKRPADAFLDFVTNSSSIIIVFLDELSAALMNSGSSYVDPSTLIYKYLEANPNCNLANVLDVEQQTKRLQAEAEGILRTFLDSSAYKCDPVKVFLREVLAGLVLEMTVQSCSKPEWINGWIIYLLEEGEPELLNAIDAGVGGATASANKENISQSARTNGIGHLNESSEGSSSERAGQSEHKRNVSRAESAMEEAMQEAKRLSELIAAEEAKKGQSQEESASSGATTVGDTTPTSSQSGLDETTNDSPAESGQRASITIHTATSSVSEPFSSFTNFDQIIRPERSNTLQSDAFGPRSSPVPMTLQNAKISIFDDAQPGEKATMRAKPAAEYLLQIEPVSSQYPGWMIARKYADFETLHEVLRRISVVSGVPKFAQNHGTLPNWKNRTKVSLRTDLEMYLQDALSYDRLAESEGMKRFLEKDQGMGRSSPNVGKGGFGFPSPSAFETMGKGMLDVLASAPKGAAGGGKAILGGVTGVLGGVGSLGQKKQAHASSSNVSKIDGMSTPIQSASISRKSQDSLRNSFSASTESIKRQSLSSRPSLNITETGDGNASPLAQIAPEPEFDDTSAQNGAVQPPPSQLPQNIESELHLPPPPSEIPDDYKISQPSSKIPTSADDQSTARSSTSSAPASDQSSSRKSISSLMRPPEALVLPPAQPAREKARPLTEEEARVAVELFFAVINELYNLSSAWNIRRTLLNAAKGFLLRPGNPNLEAIRLLLQDTIIEVNTSDAGLATHLNKLRENTLPTEEERKAWPPPPTQEEKERVRVKARKLLVERGMPQALTSVMGAAASGEALGRVFDCLQVEEVARGLMFALVLRGVRAVTQ